MSDDKDNMLTPSVLLVHELGMPERMTDTATDEATKNHGTLRYVFRTNPKAAISKRSEKERAVIMKVVLLVSSLLLLAQSISVTTTATKLATPFLGDPSRS